jgi:two-component system sensor histidine kinase DegS
MPNDNEIKNQSDKVVTPTNPQLSHIEGKADNSLQGASMQREIADLTRQKLVRELHDGLTQTVSALAMRINFARRMLASDLDEAEKELEKVEDLVRKTTREIKHMIFLLRPMEIESQGLSTALESLAEKMEELFNLEIELDIDGDLVELLPLDDHQVIYSIIEEAIDGARKRNSSAYMMVRLDKMDQQVIKLEIEDIGKSADRAESPFQGQVLDSIQKFAALIDGSVKVEKDGYLISILFPNPSILEIGESDL